MPIRIYKDEALISEPRVARTQWEKARGLMFAKPHDVLFHFPIEERLKFHMVFVFYPIDIVFLDDALRVVDLKPRFKPFTVYYSKARSSTVLESYDGFIDEHGISLGDVLTIRTEVQEAARGTIGKSHRPQSKMLHGTSLGKSRSATVTREPGATNRTSAKKTASRTTKRRTGTKKASPKTNTKKRATSTSTKKRSAVKKTVARKPSKKTASRSTKKTAAKRSAPKKRKETPKATPRKTASARSTKRKTTRSGPKKQSSTSAKKKTSRATKKRTSAKRTLAKTQKRR